MKKKNKLVYYVMKNRRRSERKKKHRHSSHTQYTCAKVWGARDIKPAEARVLRDSRNDDRAALSDAVDKIQSMSSELILQPQVAH